MFLVDCEVVAADKPYFLYVPLTHLHYPTIPNRDFEGVSKKGDFADSMMEMDARVGQIVDTLREAGTFDETLFIFASDNGPEFRRPWRGSAGMWTGTYHTAMEGSLRVPFIARWPRQIKPGVVSNEIVHVVDIFATLAAVADVGLPDDRPIDGINQLAFLTGTTNRSLRDGFVYFMRDELRAAKWRDWKMHFIWEREPNEGTKRLETPYLFNLVQDPKEETDVNATQGWVRGPIRRMIHGFARAS